MNYRHVYHAGNVADVFKHVVLIEVLRSLQKKSTPFCAIDLHAGSGLYPLALEGEHLLGIGRLWPARAHWPALADYFALVERHNHGDKLQRYPGSPLVLKAWLRAQDRALLTELQPEEVRRLKVNLADAANMTVQPLDAWQALKAFVPPHENRGLVLIDPAYERADEPVQIAAGLRHALKSWRNGIYLVWYPIKTAAAADAFVRSLTAPDIPALVVEFLTLPTDVPQRLNGSGLMIFNPPWKLDAWLNSTLTPLAQYLAGPHGRPAVRVQALGEL